MEYYWYAKQHEKLAPRFRAVSKKNYFQKQTNIEKLCIFDDEMYLTIMCTMDRRLFSSWVDVNQSTFDDDMREKRFLYFRSQ